MEKVRNRLCACCLSALFCAGAASASPEMAAASEETSALSAALSLQNVQSLPAGAAEPLDLAGLFAAWSEAVPLNTCPFIGLLLKIF